MKIAFCENLQKTRIKNAKLVVFNLKVIKLHEHKAKGEKQSSRVLIYITDT